MSTQFGIMQGRLVPPDDGRFQSFPRERWRDEFPNAVAAGIDYIEWIVDAYGADVNPILSAEGLAEFNAFEAAVWHRHAGHLRRLVHGLSAPALYL